MAQPLMNRRATPWSLARLTGANSVLIRMAEDEGRASRIAELKSKHPRLTWAKIAEHVGVTERSAIKWQRTGALDTENAAKLAELFEVDFDYIWWGPKPATPELFADRRNSPKAPAADTLSALEERLTRIETKLDRIAQLLSEASVDQDRRIAAVVERAGQALQSAKSDYPQAAAKPAPKRSRPASKQGHA